jgi:hypothetical protein
MSEDKEWLIKWTKNWHKQSNEANLPLLKWLLNGEELMLSERVDFNFYADAFQALFEAGKFDADWLLDYLADTGELQAWYDDAEFSEEED